MSFWTGTHWEPDEPAPRPARPSRRRHVFEAITEGLLVGLLITGLVAGTAAAGGKSPSPTLSVATNTARTADDGSLTVRGEHFTPSSGGQQVILWVGYPDDYCSPDGSVCHGFYDYPWVADDGTFSVTYKNVPMVSGTGTVKARQYSAQLDKWRTVDKVDYTVR